MKLTFATILSFYVLLGSIGAPVYKHICFAKEEISYSFDNQDSCCRDAEENNKTTLSTSGCCGYTSAYLQIDYDTFSNVKSPVVVAWLAQETTFLFEQLLNDSLNITDFAERGPPIFYGRTLLAFVQSFLL